MTYHSGEGSGAWRERMRYTILIGTEELSIQGSQGGARRHGSQEAGLDIMVQGSCYGGCSGLMALDGLD
jgi:hypothetical protein